MKIVYTLTHYFFKIQLSPLPKFPKQFHLITFLTKMLH
jgi:hypothetical protein